MTRNKGLSAAVPGVIVLLLLAVVGFFTLYPVGLTLWRAVATSRADSAGVAALLSDPALLWTLFNTVAIVAVSGAAAVAFGALCAWLSERTNAGGSAFERYLPILPLAIPTLAATIGWVALLSPKAGYLNALLREGAALIGITTSGVVFDIFTWWGYGFVMFLYLVPFVFILVSRALASMDPSLEAAAAINGANPWRAFRLVTLPAIKPALSAAVLIVIIQGTANFSIAIIVGTSAGIDVLSTKIYRLLYNYPPNVEHAVYVSLFMTAVVQVALLLQRNVLSGGKFSTIGGKAAQPMRVDLGLWRRPLRALMVAYMLLTSVVPLAGLIMLSLQPFWTAKVRWSALGFGNYEKILVTNPIIGKALVNSLILGVAGAVIAIGFALVIMMLVHKRSRWLSSLADSLLSLPAGLPHSIVGVAYILAFSQGLLNLHGTIWLLLIAYIVMFLPQAAGAAASASASVGKELTEAGRMNGAGVWRLFWRIQLPLMLPAVISGWVILFVHMAGELTASSLLASVRAPVVGLVLLDQWENGSFPQVAATAVVVSAVFSAVVMTVLVLTRGKAFRLR